MSNTNGSHSFSSEDVHRMMVEMQGLREQLAKSSGQSSSAASRQPAINVPPGSSSNNAAVYNYQSPSSSTANNSTLRYSATANTTDLRGQGATGNDYRSDQVEDGRSPVDLMEVLRQTPRNPAYGKPAVGSSRQPQQFMSNYPLKGKAGKKQSAPPSETPEIERPKGKAVVFGKDGHTRFHLIWASPLLRASLALFSSDDEVKTIQVRWLIDSGHSREVELYASYKNSTLIEVIRLSFENNPPAPHFPPVKFPTEGIDIVKHQPDGKLLSPDTRPILTLPNGASSISAGLRGCAHAFVIFTGWRAPSYEEHMIEREWMERFFRMTKQAYIDIHGHFDEEDNPFMTEFLADLDTHAREGYAFHPTPPKDDANFGPGEIYTSAPSQRQTFVASTAQVQLQVDPRGRHQESDSDNGDDIDASAVVKLMFAKRNKAIVPDDAKYLLGRKIQASILSSNANYHFFEQVHAMIKNKTRSIGRDEGKDIKPRVVEDVKPKVEDLDARGHKRTRHQSPEIIEIDESPSPEPQPRRPTAIRLTLSSSAARSAAVMEPSPPVETARAVTAPPVPPSIVPSVLAPAPAPITSSLSGWEAPSLTDQATSTETPINEASASGTVVEESLPGRELRSRTRPRDLAN